MYQQWPRSTNDRISAQVHRLRAQRYAATRQKKINKKRTAELLKLVNLLIKDSANMPNIGNFDSIKRGRTALLVS